MSIEFSLEKEKKLIRQVKDDPKAFDAIYRKHVDEIHRYCFLRTFSNQDAQDLTSQVFADAFANFNRFKWQNKPVVAWLYGIARNHCADFIKKAKATQSRRTEYSEEALNKNAGEDFTETFVENDRVYRLFSSIRNLPANYQEVLFLKLILDKSFKEIGTILGKKEAHCRLIAFRAIQQLKKCASPGGRDNV